MVRRTPGAQLVESVLRDCFAAKRFGVNRFADSFLDTGMHKGGRIGVEQSGTRVESLGTKEGLSREFFGCIMVLSKSR